MHLINHSHCEHYPNLLPRPRALICVFTFSLQTKSQWGVIPHPLRWLAEKQKITFWKGYEDIFIGNVKWCSNSSSEFKPRTPSWPRSSTTSCTPNRTKHRCRYIRVHGSITHDSPKANTSQMSPEEPSHKCSMSSQSNTFGPKFFFFFLFSLFFFFWSRVSFCISGWP